MSEYYVGLDLGQAQDYSALSVIERTERADLLGGRLPAHYAGRHLKGWKHGTSYPAIVKETVALLARPPMPGSQLIVDATGVGRAVVDLLRVAKLRASLVPVVITGGAAVRAHFEQGQ